VRLPALVAGELRVSASLDGSALVPWAGFCDWTLVGNDAAVQLLPVREGTFEPVPAVDRARPVARLRVDADRAVSSGTAVSSGIPVSSGTAVSSSSAASFVTDDSARIAFARQAGTLATAAQLIGLGERMLRMTVGYVKERRQFGVPIGSFQAVKHGLADALVALELARPLVHSAAWAHVHDTASAQRDVAAAKVRAGEAAGLVARTALQCHGGMGYTQEYDLHLWLKRTWALRASWGHPGELRAVVARSLNLGPDQLRPDQLQPHQIQPDQRDPDQRDPDQRDPDQRDPDQRDPDQRDPDQRDPDQRDSDQRDPDQIHSGGEHDRN
jgi:hypothetical protein